MNYVNYSRISGASSKSDENWSNPVDTLIIIINNRLIYIWKTLIAGMKSACVFHPTRAKSNYKKSRRRSRNKHSGPHRPRHLGCSAWQTDRSRSQKVTNRTSAIFFIQSVERWPCASYHTPPPLLGFKHRNRYSKMIRVAQNDFAWYI